MKAEIEAKWLDINRDKMLNKLHKIGAKLVYPECLMTRATFDSPLNSEGWCRVRDESDKITMSWKQVDDKTITGTKEICLTVDDFEQAASFLNTIGMR